MSDERSGNKRAIPVGPDGTARASRVPAVADWGEPTEVIPAKREVLPLARLGRYRLERLIGSGGMAEVYLARADGPGGFEKQVVVKRIKPVHLANQRFIEMFLREARLLSSLDHPNVVKIIELDEDGGEYFVAMEYLEGITLRDLADRNWLQQRPLPVEIVVRAVADAALGLDHAHGALDRQGRPANIVHRDVSPDNLFLTTFGATKVIDFGIAKREGIDLLTQAGEIKGKVPYMSPEQLTGQPLDGRTDLWSLGVCLYWLLAGRRPFDAATEMLTMKNIVDAEPPPLRAINPKVPASLEAVVSSCLRKDREQRIASGAALHDALMLLLVGLPKPSVTAARLVEETTPLPQPEHEVHPIVAAAPSVPWPERETASATAPTRLAMRAAEPGAAVGAGSAGEDELPPTIRLDEDDARAAYAEVQARASTALVRRERVPDAPAPKPAGRSPGLPALALVGALAVTGAALASSLWWLGMLPSTDALRPAQEEAPPRDRQPPTTQGPAGGGAAAPEDGKRRATFKAPDHVRWLTSRGALLCRGTRAVVLPDDVEAVIAHDPVRGVKTRVALGADGADYDALPRQKLVVEAPAGADVYLGTEHLGAAPLDPISVVEGTYRVRAVVDGREQTLAVEVAAGADARARFLP